jgi:hypothetical protein
VHFANQRRSSCRVHFVHSLHALERHCGSTVSDDEANFLCYGSVCLSLTRGRGPSSSSSDMYLIGIPDLAEGAVGRARDRLMQVPAGTGSGARSEDLQCSNIAVACLTDAAALAKMALAAEQECYIVAAAVAGAAVVYLLLRGRDL